MDPKNSSIIHTQAEVARRRANIETQPVRKEQLRRQARHFLDEMPKQDRFNRSSRCKLLVDEVGDLIDGMGDQERAMDDRFFADKLQDTERAITRAQQDFPEDAGMVEIEARLWDLIKDKAKALRALERAWKKVPRGSGIAIRLSKIHGSAGRLDAAKAVLDEALGRDAEDKAAHFAMAMHLISSADGEDWDKRAITYHLSASFQVNDTAFEERYVLAQFLFATGSTDRAEALFEEIGRRAPKDFRKFAPKAETALTRRIPNHAGSVESIREGFFWLRSGAYAKRIFAHRSAFEEAEVDEIEIGQQVYFRLRFNRRGPVAVSVHLKPSGWSRVGAELPKTDPEMAEALGS